VNVGTIVLLLGGCLLTGCGLRDMPAAAAEVSQAVDSLLANAVQGTWSATYPTMTTPEFRQKVSQEQYDSIGLAIHDRLGKLASKSTKSFFVRSMNGVVSAEAVYDAQFEKAPGTIRTMLVKTAAGWRFHGFWVDSPVFNTPSVPCVNCGKPRPSDAAFCPACGKKIDPAQASSPGK
jgi:hypothetical protein